MSVISTHNAGFFSCCNVKLYDIVTFINKHKRLPDVVDSSAQFEWYKNKEGDVTYEYFLNPNDLEGIDITEPIHYHWNDQYIAYKDVDYAHLNPVVKKYFSPSKEILDIVHSMEEKYALDYSNLCVLFYRGNDKMTETVLCAYLDYVRIANEILSKNPTIQFLIQSDETEFLECMKQIYPNNTIIFNDEIRHIPRANDTVDRVFKDTNHIYSKKFLAITILMSKAKYVVCGSANCSLWIALYRGHAKNMYQFGYSQTWIEPQLE